MDREICGLRNGRHEETRTPDLYRVKGAISGFTITYNGSGRLPSTRKHVEDGAILGGKPGSNSIQGKRISFLGLTKQVLIWTTPTDRPMGGGIGRPTCELH
jgi:hypothetical protein